MDVAAEIARRGGAAKTCELLAAGATPAALRWALGVGRIRRPRKGWYVLPGTPRPALESVRVGGRATCVTALRSYGVWVTPEPGLPHVAVHRAATRLRSRVRRDKRQSLTRDAVVHWRETPTPRQASARLTEPVLVALRDAVACLSPDDLFASAESVLALRLVTMDAWCRWLETLRPAQRSVLSSAGTLSASGLESIFCRRIRNVVGTVRQQVWCGADRVDVVIGDRLVVELDGHRFHDRRADYRRNARLIAAGFYILRFDYDQVLHEWDTVEAAVLVSLRRGDHRR